MSEVSRDRIERLVELWRRERAAVKRQLVEERARTPLAERVARGTAVRELTLEEVDAAPGGRVLLWLAPPRPGDLDGLRIGPGDPVRLWWEQPDAEDAVTGVLARRRAGVLGVMVEREAPERLLDGAACKLDRDDPGATFERGERALDRFLHAPPGSDLARLREVLYGGAVPEFEDERELTPCDAQLNAPQLAAVRRALAARDVALVHGPPGTGKTRTLVEVIRQAVERRQRVLATAASNAAVDNLAQRLIEAGLDVVRLGHPARVAAPVEARSLDALMERSEGAALARDWLAQANALRLTLDKRWARRSITWQERREGMAEVGRLFRDARAQRAATERGIVASAPVVCATAAGADAQVLGDLRFDLIVVDEATQAPDPVALVALQRGARAVLAGDPHQLPPTVVDVAAEREGLGRTAFEVLASAGKGDPLRLLVVQHRMHEAIMAFPSASKYEGRLEAAPAVAAHLLEDQGAAPDPLRPGPLLFLDTAGKGWEEERARDDPSTRNPAEGRRLAAEVRRLLGRGVPPTNVGVITPYDAQVRLLREQLEDEVRAGLEVGTVDGFQGREKEAIVVGLVRSNPDAELGFLRDTRRMNVALTRARRFLLVVGDSGTLAQHPYYAGFLEAVGAYGLHLSAWTDDCPPFGEE